MVVGEPSLMGGEFGDEDERLITRLENHQYDPSAAGAANGLDEGGDFGAMGPGGPGGPPSTPGGPPPSWQGGPPPGPPITSSGGPPMPQGDKSSGLNGGSNNTSSGVPEENKKQSPN